MRPGDDLRAAYVSCKETLNVGHWGGVKYSKRQSLVRLRLRKPFSPQSFPNMISINEKFV